MADHKKKLSWVIITMLPLLYGMLVVSYFGVNQPFWDDWNALQHYFNIKSGTFSFGELLNYHNGHCIFFPNIILTAVAVLTNANLKVDMYVSMLLVALMYLVWLKVFRYDIKTKSQELMVVLMVGFCVFNSIQFENFLWGFQVGFVLTACMMLLTVYLFQRSKMETVDLNMILAIICGTVATFSSAMGMMALITISVLSVFYSIMEKRVRKGFLLVWISTIMVCLIYLNGYKSSGTHFDLYRFVSFFLALVGAPFGLKRKKLAIIIGLIMLLTTVVLCVNGIRKKLFQKYVFEYCVIVMTLFTFAAISIGRSDFGAQYAAETYRYTTFSLWIYLADMLLVLKMMKGTVKRNVIQLLFIVSFFGLNLAFFHKYSDMKSFRDFLIYKMSNYEKMPLEELYGVYAWDKYEDAYRDIERYYQSTGLKPENNVFCSSYLEEKKSNNQDVVWGIGLNDFCSDDMMFYTRNGYVVNQNSLVNKVYVNIGDEYYETFYGLDRPDVGDVYGDQFRKSGILFSIRKDDICEGDNLKLIAVMDDGSQETIELGQVLF